MSEKKLPNIGEEFADFIIDGILGDGGEGIVYRVVDPFFPCFRALKVKHPHKVIGTTVEENFPVERIMLGEFSDRSNFLVPITGGVWNGLPYIVVEHMSFGSVDAQLRALESNLLSVNAASFLCVQVAIALHFVVDRGIAHRDIKAPNILLTDRGDIKIADFGYAVEMSDSGSVDVSGTPTHMSPEQFRGEKLTPASDLFSLGVMYYRMLTGKRPFEDKNIVRIRATEDYSYIGVTEQQPEVPDSIARIVDKLLQPRVESRFQKPIEVVRAIRDAIPLAELRAGRNEVISSVKFRLEVRLTKTLDGSTDDLFLAPQLE